MCTSYRYQSPVSASTPSPGGTTLHGYLVKVIHGSDISGGRCQEGKSEHLPEPQPLAGTSESRSHLLRDGMAVRHVRLSSGPHNRGANETLTCYELKFATTLPFALVPVGKRDSGDRDCRTRVSGRSWIRTSYSGRPFHAVGYLPPGRHACPGPITWSGL